MNSNIEMPTCGRVFRLGMLYNSAADKPINRDYQLWSMNSLQKAQHKQPCMDTQFNIIHDDTLATKCQALDADRASLRMNLLAGMTRVSGASKYFTDNKSTRDLIRITIQFKYTSHMHEVNIQKLGKIQNQIVVSATRATHVVTKVLFGLEAFLVIDRPYSIEENITAIQEKIFIAAQFLAQMYISGKSDLAQLDQYEVEKYKFKFYSDATLLARAPSTFKEVIAFLEKHIFSHFKEGSDKLLPKKVWLYPINKLDSSAPTIVQEVNEDDVRQVKRITEELKHAEVCINDVNKISTQTIQFFQEQQIRLAGLITQFCNDMTKQLETVIPNIRNGSAERSQLNRYLRQIEGSPFGSDCISSLLKDIELEIRVVSQFLDSLTSDSVNYVTSDEIDALAIDFDYIFSFEFRLGGSRMATLDKMETYLQAKKPSELLTTTRSKVTPWYKDGSRKRAVQIQAKLFKEFALINSERDDIHFVVQINSNSPSPSREGAAVILYADDDPIEFELPSKPLKVCITEDAGNELHLAWTKPKHGKENVISYSVTFYSTSTREKKTVTTVGPAESIVVYNLAPEQQYEFVVQAECSAGLSPKSEILKRMPLSEKAPNMPRPVPRKRPNKSSTLPAMKSQESKPGPPVKNKPLQQQTAFSDGFKTPLLPAVRKKPILSPVIKRQSDGTGPKPIEKNMGKEQENAASFKSPTPRKRASRQPSSDTDPIVVTSPKPLAPQRLQQFEAPIELKVPPRSHQPNQHHLKDSRTQAQRFSIAASQTERQQFSRNPTSIGTLRQKLEQVLLAGPLPSQRNSGLYSAPPVRSRLQSGSPHHTTGDQFDSPQPKNVTHNSISLEWRKPSLGGDTVQCYSVHYCTYSSSSDDIPKVKRIRGTEERTTIDHLMSTTRYIFRVQATFSSGVKKESKPTGAIYTKIHLAKTIRQGAKLIHIKNAKQPAIYELTKTQAIVGSNRKRMAKYEVGNPTERGSMKVLMLVGATGAGKTILINSIANYMYGVQWKNEFRFILVTNESATRSHADSRTSWITAYTLYRGEGSPLPYSLTIIDTPGFGGVGGVKRDKEIADQIRNFFSLLPPLGVDTLHGVGFVAQASQVQLSPSQQYIFDSISSIYGREIEQNIFLMSTFADVRVSPVIKIAKISHQTCFKFDNSTLFVTGKENSLGAMNWKMGKESFDDFFTQFGKAEPRSLQLTREVLREREKLENILKELRPQIHAGLTKMNELQTVTEILQHNKDLIEHIKDFTLKVPVVKQLVLDAPPGQYTTSCLNCNYTCHDDCAYANNDNKKDCCAMDRDGMCTVCPRNCAWSLHVNNPYIFSFYEEEEVRTSDDLKDRYDTAMEGESRAETMIANIEDELYALEIIVLESVDKARRSLIRLEEIAHKSNPLSEVDYIDQLIVSEEQQGKRGWQDRIAAYNKLKNQAEVLHKIRERDKRSNESLISWLKSRVTLIAEKSAQQRKGIWHQFWKS